MTYSVNSLFGISHSSCAYGLRQAGVSVDRIPKIEEINRALERNGWSAVAVDGYISPQVFMEFQANKILPISPCIRSVEKIDYSFTPDIIHEAIGHVSVLADSEFSDYLVRFGEISKRVFWDSDDRYIYDIIRRLSILKDLNDTAEISNLENELRLIQSNRNTLSEMAQLRNLYWWTVEYGVIGGELNHKVYGAALLSSVNEVGGALIADTQKEDYTLEAKDVDFDVTNYPDKLYVTPDVEWLNEVLSQFEKTLAFAQGGVMGIEKAITSGNLATYVFNSGIQVSGIVDSFIEKDGDLIYVSNRGMCQMSFSDVEIKGHGVDVYTNGFGSPVGVLKESEQCLSFYDDVGLNELGIIKGKEVVLNYLSGIKVKGVFEDLVKE